MNTLLAALAVATARRGRRCAEYPEKPITIVVPFAAGGPTDKVARDLAEALRKPLNGQTHHHRERRRRRRHARRGQGGHGRARRLHAAAAPHRHGHVAGAVPQPAVQDARGLRVPRHDQRSADDADRPARRCRPTTTPSWSSGSRPTRARSTSPTPASARPRTCAACCSSRALKIDMTDGAVQGHGAGHDRPARRPGRHHVRPDDQHHQPDRERQGQGLRRDDAPSG